MNSYSIEMEKAIALLILLLISPAAYAATHDVGGNSGWNTGVNYDGWASGQTFRAGDTLVFNFDPRQHSVDEVNQSAYQTCNIANPMRSHTTSPTTISLTAPGNRYFICPRSNHCLQDMKLAVNVVAGTATPSGPGGNGVATTLGGCSGGLMVGSSLVLAALLG